MAFRRALLASAIVLSPVATGAQAQSDRSKVPPPVSGAYVKGSVGPNLLADQKSNGLRVKAKGVGVATVGAIGYGFGNGMRVEAEANYRNTQIGKFTQNGAQIGNSGVVHGYGAMANLVYDIPLGSRLVPYIGGGAGYVWQDLKNIRGNAGGSAVTIDETQGAFAYQGIAGAAYNFTDQIALSAEYRYLATLGSTYGVQRNPAQPGQPTGFKTEPQNHSVLLGLRYAFNAPPAEPEPLPRPAMAAPAPARTYLVFFDWDKAILTERARQIVGEAAANARGAQATRIEVAGHADRSGTPQYNQRLSQRRADAVVTELVRQGINRREIMVTAFGESRPLVPTADGVREPQNRRVEIVLR